MRRVLIISTVGLIYDGITNVILSNIEAMDLCGLEFYIAGTLQIETEIKEKFEKNGVNVWVMPNRKTNVVKYFLKLIRFIKKQKIDVIHVHGNSATMAIELLAGVFGGCKKRITHCHNTRCDHVKADKCLRPLFNRLYTDALACGKDAGCWLFNEKPFTVINNGREIDKYSFSINNRNFIRKKYNIADELVIGHVGGFYEQKNHRFLIDIFKKIKKTIPSTKFFLIGDGPLKEEIKKLSMDLDIIFTGAVDGVEIYLSAMDGMIFPSLFEGFPLVVVEWQINGLPTVISDTITDECVFTDFVKKVPLNADQEIWVKEFLDVYSAGNRNQNTLIAKKIIGSSGYNIKESSKALRKIYLS